MPQTFETHGTNTFDTHGTLTWAGLTIESWADEDVALIGYPMMLGPYPWPYNAWSDNDSLTILGLYPLYVDEPYVGPVPSAGGVSPLRRTQNWNPLERTVLRMIGEDDGTNNPLDSSAVSVPAASETTKEWTALERKLLRMVGGIHE